MQKKLFKRFFSTLYSCILLWEVDFCAAWTSTPTHILSHKIFQFLWSLHQIKIASILSLGRWIECNFHKCTLYMCEPVPVCVCRLCRKLGQLLAVYDRSTIVSLYATWGVEVLLFIFQYVCTMFEGFLYFTRALHRLILDSIALNVKEYTSWL